MAKQLNAEIEVQASPDRVWEVLTDFAAYHQWNPFIVQATGQAVPGSRLELKMRPPGGRTTTSAPRSWRPTRAASCAGSAVSSSPACSTASTASPSSPRDQGGSA